MISARTTCDGTMTSVSSRVLRTAGQKLTSVTIVWTGCRLIWPVLVWKASVIACSIGHRKKMDMKISVGARRRYGAIERRCVRRAAGA